MARQSTQHKLDRVRSPRVHITYDVEVGGAIELKELRREIEGAGIDPSSPSTGREGTSAPDARHKSRFNARGFGPHGLSGGFSAREKTFQTA